MLPENLANMWRLTLIVKLPRLQYMIEDLHEGEGRSSEITMPAGLRIHILAARHAAFETNPITNGLVVLLGLDIWSWSSWFSASNIP